MPDTNQQSADHDKAEQLARLADSLQLEITDENLTALAKQLRFINALDETDLQDQPPILRMDAAWHD